MCDRRHSTWCSASHWPVNSPNVGVAEPALAGATVSVLAATSCAFAAPDAAEATGANLAANELPGKNAEYTKVPADKAALIRATTASAFFRFCGVSASAVCSRHRTPRYV